MINLSNEYFLMIEPDRVGKKADEPINDELTEAVKLIFSKATIKGSYRGFHLTACNKASDNKDWVLPNGMRTNNLCVYYIQYYRPYVPESEINKIIDVFNELFKK